MSKCINFRISMKKIYELQQNISVRTLINSERELWRVVVDKVLSYQPGEEPKNLFEYFSPGHSFLYYIDQNIVGIGGWVNLNGCRLSFLGVYENFRKQGIGKFIVKHCLNDAYLSGYSVICVCTTIDRPAAISLYKSLGFKEIQ